MAKIQSTLLEEITINFDAIFKKIESYQGKLENSLSHYETDKYVENLIMSQRLLKELSAKVDLSLHDLIDSHY